MEKLFLTDGKSLQGKKLNFYKQKHFGYEVFFVAKRIVRIYNRIMEELPVNKIVRGN